MDRYLGIAKALLHRGLELKKELIIPDVTDFGEEISLILPDKMPDAFIWRHHETRGLVDSPW